MKKALFGLWRIMSLRDKYLSLVIVSALFSTSVFSQAVDTTKILQNIEATGYNWKGGKFRSYLVIPSDTPKLKVADSGAVSYKGGSQWLWTGKLWKKSSGGGTTIFQSADSTYFTYINETGGRDTVIFVGSGVAGILNWQVVGGNVGVTTPDTTRYIGTNNNTNLLLKTNNITRIHIDSTGKFELNGNQARAISDGGLSLPISNVRNFIHGSTQLDSIVHIGKTFQSLSLQIIPATITTAPLIIREVTGSNTGLVPAAIHSQLEFGLGNLSYKKFGNAFDNPSYNTYGFRLYGDKTAGGSGGGIYNEFLVSPNLNFTGNASNGTYNGIIFNPTVTNLTLTDVRAFTNTIGNNLFGTTSGSVGIGAGTTIAPSAILDVKSINQGVLLPRMTTTQKNAISTPAEGLEVYDLTLHQKSYWNGTIWVNY